MTNMTGTPSMNFIFLVLWLIVSMVRYIAGAPPSADKIKRFFSLTRRLCLIAAFLSCTVTAAAMILMMAKYI